MSPDSPFSRICFWRPSPMRKSVGEQTGAIDTMFGQRLVKRPQGDFFARMKGHIYGGGKHNLNYAVNGRYSMDLRSNPYNSKIRAADSISLSPRPLKFTKTRVPLGNNSRSCSGAKAWADSNAMQQGRDAASQASERSEAKG